MPVEHPADLALSGGTRFLSAGFCEQRRVTALGASTAPGAEDYCAQSVAEGSNQINGMHRGTAHSERLSGNSLAEHLPPTVSKQDYRWRRW